MVDPSDPLDFVFGSLASHRAEAYAYAKGGGAQPSSMATDPAIHPDGQLWELGVALGQKQT